MCPDAAVAVVAAAAATSAVAGAGRICFINDTLIHHNEVCIGYYIRFNCSSRYGESSLCGCEMRVCVHARHIVISLFARKAHTPFTKYKFHANKFSRSLAFEFYQR